MQEIKKRKVKKSFLLRFAVFIFAVYMVWGLVNQQIKINEKRQQLSKINQQMQIQEIKNGEIKNALASSGNNSDYIEQKAREDLGYAKPGERVFINIAGK
jgi:cell division protein FtsB